MPSNILIKISYLLIINLIGFFAMWIDKTKAKKGKWRISETSLLGIGFFGGSIGEIIAMYIFRHKTKKKRFTIGLPLCLILDIIIYYFYISKIF